VRRLERLARYKLVTKRVDGTWFVPPNLVNTLRAREESHPRFRLVAELLRPELARKIEPTLPEVGRKLERRPPELGRDASSGHQDSARRSNRDRADSSGNPNCRSPS
jgi:hypothetical protein